MSSDLPLTAPYALLQARGVGARSVEVLNAGIVLWLPTGPRVAMATNTKRLAALHPDYAALDLPTWGQSLERVLAQHQAALPDANHLVPLLDLLGRPFTPGADLGLAAIENDPDVTLREMLRWLVDAPVQTDDAFEGLGASAQLADQPQGFAVPAEDDPEEGELERAVAIEVFGLTAAQVDAWPWGPPPFSTQRDWAAAVLVHTLAHPGPGVRARFDAELAEAAMRWGWRRSPDQEGPGTLALLLTPDEICMAALKAVRGCGAAAPT